METPAPSDPNPVNPPRAARPAAGEPPASPPDDGPRTLSGWFRENLFPILFVGLLIWFIYYKNLNWPDILKVAVGLGLVIFIHELGHFLAAKWCDVHVETFSVGFGKPIPGCVFRYGETTYKLGWIPLGGYVKMVGEGEGAESEDAEEDPRSFKHKSVAQRMLIISAGVIMNLLLAGLCFVVAYSHGVEEKPPVIGWVDPGSPAWQAGLHSGSVLERMDNLKAPKLMFDDIRPKVMGTSKGEKLEIVYRNRPDGEPITVEVEPSRDADALYPTIGVGPSFRPVLYSSKRPGFKPFREGSPAARANPPLQMGDRIVAMTDPADLTRVTGRSDGGPLDQGELNRRLALLRGVPVTLRLMRADGSEATTVLEPAFTHKGGLRMLMGRVAAVRDGSGAAKARMIDPADPEVGIRAGQPGTPSLGDKLIGVEVRSPDRTVRFVSEPVAAGPGEEVRPLDPLRLPFDLSTWAATVPGGQPKKVLLTVLRLVEQKHAQQRVTLEADWDDSARFHVEILASANSPLPIPELGLAYHVEAAVDEVESYLGLPPAAGIVGGAGAAVGQPTGALLAGLQKGDLIKEVRGKTRDKKGNLEPGDWQPVKTHQWASIFASMQFAEVKEFDLRVERGANKVEELTLRLAPDLTWPAVDRGMILQEDVQLHQAENLLHAVELGWHRTWRTVRVIYQNLYAMMFARVSARTMSGPLTIASVSYNIAGRDFWQFILFLGMINVNLAVINFLPIPALDGGHMVLLIYEGLRGKPAPDSVQLGLQLLGVALILGLMIFVIFLDVQRLFF